MYLTLEITGQDAGRFGSQRSHTFDVDGGRIGRAPDNEWVIPDQYIHGVHAVVTFMSGLFFIEKRGQNRVAVNRPESDLPIHEPFPLKNGDRLYLDEYELAVTVSPTAPARPSGPAMPATTMPLDPITGSRERATPSAAPLIEMDDPGGLDPLESLGSTMQRRALKIDPSQLPDPSILSHGSVLSDHFQAPNLLGPGAGAAGGSAAGGGFIPDDWDRTSMARVGVKIAAPGYAPPPPLSAPPPMSAPPAMAVPPSMSAPSRVAASRPAPAPPQAPAAPAGPATLGAFTEPLGLPAGQLSGADLASLGRALRSSLSGLIVLLQGRAQIRARFRIAQTRSAAADPNPLRNAANVEDALHELFQHRRAGAMAADQAVAEGFDEARRHQLAMLEAMRAAFDALITRLDPAAQGDRADTAGKRGALIGLPGRSRQWENYLEYFREQVGNNRDEAFQRLFGAEFASAYEKELERLRTVDRRRTPR